MSKHEACESVRLSDRCVECNPGYGDPDQTYWIYREAKRNGGDLRAAEQSYVRKHRGKK